MRKLTGLVSALVLAASALWAGNWHEDYELGLRSIRDGDGQAAVEALLRAVEAEPEPRLRAPTEGPRYVDYLPYLYLAVASHLTGDIEASNDYLAQSEAAGVAASSEAGRPLIESYRTLLGHPSPPDDPVSYKEYEAQPVVLSEAEYEAARESVASRCGLAQSGDLRQAPWYFHYELGLELAKQGDPQRALDAIVDATEQRGEPKRSARMYGMWFIDYLPYWEIAQIHAQLGNWDCARDALRLSEAKGEITQDNEQYDDLWALREEIAAHGG